MRLRYEILLFLFSVAFVYLGAKVFRTLYLTKGSSMCPDCGDSHIKISTPRWPDLPFRIFRFVAYRCMACDSRFHRPRLRAHAHGPATAHQ
jgi:hypothetical protein